MIRKIIFSLLLAALLLTGCKSKDKNENYVYQRDPDVAGTVDKHLEKDAPFAALQEILYIDSSRDKIYDKAREEGIVESCRQTIYERIVADYNKAMEDKKYDKAISIYFSLLAIEKTSLIGDPDIIQLYLDAAENDYEKENYISALYKFYKYLNFTKPSQELLVKYGDLSVSQNNRYMLRLIAASMGDCDKKTEYIEILKNLSTPAEMMKGTVTIWVNRGTKLQYGVGVPDRSIGSGFFIDKRGYVITNYHVIESEVNPEYEGFSQLFIRLPDAVGSRVPAKVVAWDPIFDIALLKTEIDPEYIFNFSLDNSYNPGDRIFAIGSPGGLENTITAGIVSAGQRRFLPLGDVLQVDVPVNPGNSGGPLINEKNEVIGVVFAGIPRFQNINFAIPSHWVMDLLSGMYDGGQVVHSWLGLSMYEKNNTLEVLYAIPGESGCVAGLQNGDIIKTINGIEIKTITQVHKILNTLAPDTLLCIGWERDGKSHTSYIATKKRPRKAMDIALRKDSKKNIMLPLFGMQVESTGNYVFKEGYVIKKVYQGLPAYEADLSANDPFSLRGWKYDSKNRYVAMQIYVKKKKAGFMETGLQLAAYLDDNNLI